MRLQGQINTAQPVHPAMSAKTWVVLASSRIAKIFLREGRHFKFMSAIQSPYDVGNGLNEETVGRGNTYGAARHKIEPTMAESRQGEIRLAREIAERLDQSLSRGRYEHLVLIAAPQMLGEIRRCLSKNVAAAIVAEANRDIANHPEQDLDREILSLIPGPDHP